MSCSARQYSDQMACSRCGLQWDLNDMDPPPCRSAADIRAEALLIVYGYEMAKIRKTLK